MEIRLYEKGAPPPPSADGVVDDISSEHVPLAGDLVQIEGKNGEVMRLYRVVTRLFRTVSSSGTTEVALEVERLS
jgi:hypothetical protein